MFRTSHKFRKLKCIKDDIPTRSEIQQQLGNTLAQVLFDYSHPEVIKLLDSVPSRQSCCTTRKGQLQTKAICTWSKKQQTLKSHIHHDILALGEGELKKFQAEIEATTQNKLRDEFAEKCRMLDAEKRFAVKRNTNEIHARYEEYFKSTQQELEKELQVEWADVNAKHNKELQKAIAKARIDTTRDLLTKIRPQTYRVITSLYNDLERSCHVQKQKMMVDFNNIMREQHIELGARIREVERKKIEELRVQRHELEIRSITDIIYILCMERLRSSLQMNAMHKHFEEKIKSLRELIAKKDEAMNVMKKRITEYRNENTILQEKATAIAKEFQKFINFAFDAMPEHADFLLPLNLFSVNSTNKEDDEQERK